jgi:hypothetical protein
VATAGRDNVLNPTVDGLLIRNFDQINYNTVKALRDLWRGISRHPLKALGYVFTAFSVIFTIIKGLNLFVPGIEITGPIALTGVMAVSVCYGLRANGTDVPTDSDIKYYNLMKAWTEKDDDDFTMINSHDKASSVRDSSKKATLKASIQERLRNSKNMVLIIGKTTRFDMDWVPFEIGQAIDSYKIPIIAAYLNYDYILAPDQLRVLWPSALATRIDNKTARVIHIPFKKEPLSDAIGQFNHENIPRSPLAYYGRDAYVGWGLLT